MRRNENRVYFHFFKLQMHYNYAFVAVTVNTSYSVLGLYSQLTHIAGIGVGIYMYFLGTYIQACMVQ